MGMISATTRYVGCYRCSEGAADSTSASFNSLRAICTFKGTSDTCNNISDCGTCEDWEEVGCHSTHILPINATQTDGDCTISVEKRAVESLASNTTHADQPVLTTAATIIISFAAVLCILTAVRVYRDWEWLRVYVLGKQSKKYISEKKAAQKTHEGSIRATLRSIKEIESVRIGSSMRHPATNPIFNPRFIQQSGIAGRDRSVYTSYLSNPVEHANSLNSVNSTGGGTPLTDDPSSLFQRQRGVRRPPSDPGDPHI
jgi:hypothetical protein